MCISFPLLPQSLPFMGRGKGSICNEIQGNLALLVDISVQHSVHKPEAVYKYDP